MNRIVEVNRAACGDTRIVEVDEPPLGEGLVRLRIDHLAVTANNVTYAVIGDLFGYWDFFPGSDGWGRVPFMGWAEVIESNQPDIEVGGRYYGWFPMAETVDIMAAPTADGFRDDGDHRTEHAPVYRSFVRTDRDGLHPDRDPNGASFEGNEGEHRHALLRGLFITGFLADAFFADAPGAEPYFGVDRVVVASASSKTAIGFAQLAHERGLHVVGLTSAGNVDFVRSLGCYDETITYDEIDTLSKEPSVAIDMAGNASVLAALHAHLDGQLKYSMTVGKSHHDAAPVAIVGGPAPQLFFAPTEVTRRIDAWGSDGYRDRVATATHRFVDGSTSWLEVQVSAGVEGGESTWTEVFGGTVPPSVGRIVAP